jgi:D-serine deaminase-like pyridoxal phosphate-dependent protein
MNAEQALAATEGIDTPVAVLDEAAMERNLTAMARHAAGAGLALRPHAKTHKSGWIGMRQVEHGAIGLTVATLQEAETFAAAGVDDLLVAFPPAGEARLRRLAALAPRVRRLAVGLDDVELARQVPEAVEVLWEVDTGLHRVGTEPGEPTARAVQELVAAIGQARFRGLVTHGGHAYGGDRRGAAEDERSGLVATAELLRQAGVEVRELSVGSTPTAGFATAGSGLTEMRPGTYVFGDANQVVLGSHALADCALAVAATVVSRHASWFVVDAGSKALPADLRVTGLQGFGTVVGRPELRVERLSEEHAVVEGGSAAVGDRLLILPAHVCTAVNLHPELLVFGPAGIRWEPVTARGWRSPGG